MRNKCEVKVTTHDEETGKVVSDIINLYDLTSLSRLLEKIRWHSRYTIAPYSGVEYQDRPLFLGDTVEFNGETLIVACDERGYHLEKITRVEFGDLNVTPAVTPTLTPATTTVLAEPQVTTIEDDDERPIPGFLGYLATTSGEIRSIKYGDKRTLKTLNKNGYNYVQLRVNDKYTARRVDFLVALAFIDDTLTSWHNIVHKNGDLNDNSVGNLIIKK